MNVTASAFDDIPAAVVPERLRHLPLIDQVLCLKGRYEIVGGRIIELPMGGRLHAVISANIGVGLREWAAATGRGLGGSGGLDYHVPQLRPRRESFRPDAGYYVGPVSPDPMDGIPGAPTFAVEVRSKDDYGPAAELKMAEKRADYFAAGTLAVWDVDPEAGTVALYRRESPAAPVVFRKGETADAGDAVPGWAMPVDEVFA
jgi:Uma2 family endonuclease